MKTIVQEDDTIYLNLMSIKDINIPVDIITKRYTIIRLIYLVKYKNSKQE